MEMDSRNKDSKQPEIEELGRKIDRSNSLLKAIFVLLSLTALGFGGYFAYPHILDHFKDKENNRPQKMTAEEKKRAEQLNSNVKKLVAELEDAKNAPPEERKIVTFSIKPSFVSRSTPDKNGKILSHLTNDEKLTLVGIVKDLTYIKAEYLKPRKMGETPAKETGYIYRADLPNDLNIALLPIVNGDPL